MTFLDLLDEVKRRHNIATDYQLAKVMGVSKQRLYQWRGGKAYADDSAALRLAELLDMDEGAALAVVHGSRAKDPTVAEAWNRLASRLSGAAPAVLAAVALAAMLSAAPSPAALGADSVYYVKSWLSGFALVLAGSLALALESPFSQAAIQRRRAAVA